MRNREDEELIKMLAIMKRVRHKRALEEIEQNEIDRINAMFRR